MSRLMAILLALAVLGLAACGNDESSPTTAPEAYRIDLGAGVVVAFLKGQSPDGAGKVAYVTHVPSGTQAVVDGEGRIIERHDGRDDGPSRLDAVFADEATMSRITGGIQSNEEPRTTGRVEVIDWVPLFQFGGIKYVNNWNTEDGILTVGDLTELYRVAFKVDGHAESSYLSQDGDATYLSPGTPVYAVKGYSHTFRLGTVEDGKVTIYEADTNPLAKIGEDLLDIRGKVSAIDILSEEDAATVLGKIDEGSAVSQFVEAVLASPVDRGSRDREGERYFLGFRLTDGTSVVRAYRIEANLLQGGIVTDPVVATYVRRALSPDGRSASTGVTDPLGDSSNAASWVPTPDSIQHLVNMADAVAIAVVLRLDREVQEGPYNASSPSHTGDTQAPKRFPYSYYEFEIRDLLLDDGYISTNRLIKLKGHAGDGALSRRIALPEPGDMFVFFLSRNPDDRSYSFLGPWAIISMDTGAPTQFGGTHAVPTFALSLDSDEFLEAVRSSIGTRTPTAPLSGVTVIGARGGSESPASQLAATPTPEPLQPGTEGSMPPDHVRLDLDPKVVVAFVDDDDLGRIAYVTHVPSGAQVVLDAESNVLEKHSGSSAGDRALEIALKDVHVMERIQRGLLSEEILPGNGFMDWINFIRFGGISYSSKARRGGGDQVEKSRLGEVLYRVAFHVDANLVPGSYRPRDGDAAFLPLGTPIHSVDGYPPSERLAAVVDGEVWLFRRSGPAASNATPTPAVVPGQPQVDRVKEAEKRRRQVMARFETEEITWIDHDTVVYVLPTDPHDLGGPKVAVAQHLPTGAALNYDLDGVRGLIVKVAKGVEIHPDAPAEAARMDGNPDVRSAAYRLLKLHSLPWCDEIERPSWPKGVPTPVPTAQAVPTPVPTGAPGHGTDSQPGNVRCVARPTATDTPRPGKSDPDNAAGPSADRPYYNPTLDVDYDDSWVANIPSTIGGYEVRYITTPKSRACSVVPKISLQISRDSSESSSGLLDVHSLKEVLRSIPGVPHNIGLSFTPRRFDSEEKAANDADWNERRLKEGCIRLGGPIELKDEEGG